MGEQEFECGMPGKCGGGVGCDDDLPVSLSSMEQCFPAMSASTTFENALAHHMTSNFAGKGFITSGGGS